MNWSSLVRLAFSVSSSSRSAIADALRFREFGTPGVETLRMLFTIRVNCGSGSKHNGCDVAIWITSIEHEKMLYICVRDEPISEPLLPTHLGLSMSIPPSDLTGIHRPRESPVSAARQRVERQAAQGQDP